MAICKDFADGKDLTCNLQLVTCNLYDIYLPLSGYKHKIWTLAKGKIIKEDTLEIVGIPSIILKEIKVQDLDHLDFTENEIINFSSIFKVGDQVLTGIEEMFDGVKLVAKQNKL